jgi:hypothetical protein
MISTFLEASNFNWLFSKAELGSSATSAMVRVPWSPDGFVLGLPPRDFLKLNQVTVKWDPFSM